MGKLQVGVQLPSCTVPYFIQIAVQKLTETTTIAEAKKQKQNPGVTRINFRAIPPLILTRLLQQTQTQTQTQTRGNNMKKKNGRKSKQFDIETQLKL